MPQERRRRRTRRRKKTRFPGLYKAVSAILILGAVVVACVVFFRVGRVEVRGNVRYTAQEIIDVSGVKVGDNLFRLDRGRIARELQSQLPYVETVAIRRELPDGVSIVITEGDAVAAIAHGGKWWLMGADGKLLEEAQGPGEYPTVLGLTPLAPAVGTRLATAEERQERVGWLRELLGGLEENRLLDGLESVDLSEDYRVTFRYGGHFTVHISPTLEKGMSYWLRRFGEAMENPQVDSNGSYTVEITDNQRLRFIPD